MTMRIYLASPSTQLQASCMKGQRVLESFALCAKSPWVVRYRPTFASMMLDSGAYSVMSKGKTVDLGAYIEFCQEHGRGYESIVNLDVISGDVPTRIEQSKANWQKMRDAKIDAMPVFHQGEPWSLLGELASYGRVGLGLQRPIREVDRFLDDCFSRIPASVKVHGFAMANEKYTMRCPFDSVDSATWMHELKALMALKGQGSDVLRYMTVNELLAMVVLKYERLQRATAWNPKGETLSLFPDDDASDEP